MGVTVHGHAFVTMEVGCGVGVYLCVGVFFCVLLCLGVVSLCCVLVLL